MPLLQYSDSLPAQSIVVSSYDSYPSSRSVSAESDAVRLIDIRKGWTWRPAKLLGRQVYKQNNNTVAMLLYSFCDELLSSTNVQLVTLPCLTRHHKHPPNGTSIALLRVFGRVIRCPLEHRLSVGHPVQLFHVAASRIGSVLPACALSHSLQVPPTVVPIMPCSTPCTPCKPSSPFSCSTSTSNSSMTWTTTLRDSKKPFTATRSMRFVVALYSVLKTAFSS